MKKINQIQLSHLEKNLDNCLIKLDHNFLKELLQIASKTNFPYKNERFVESIGLSFNKSAKRSIGLNSLMRKNRSLKFFTLRKILKLTRLNWVDIEQNIISLRLGRRNGEIYPKFPIELDKNMGCIIGHILGDGSVDKKYLQISYNNKNKDLIIEFYNCMKTIFRVEPRIWIQKSGKFKEKTEWIKRLKSINNIPNDTQTTLFYPSICGLILNLIFDNFAIGKNKKIEGISPMPNEFKIGLIRAFFDDEGHMDKLRGPRFHQDNKNILIKIKELLNELGITSYPIRFYMRKNKPRYFFNINHKNNYSKYYYVIGCTSDKKQKALYDLINKTK